MFEKLMVFRYEQLKTDNMRCFDRFCVCGFSAPASAWQPDDVVGILPKRLQPLLEEDPGSGPSELGGLVADCVRWVAQTDLAIVPAGDLEQDLPVGEVRWEDVTRAVNEDRQLAEAEITPAQLYALWRSYYPIYRSIWQMSH